jgi:hypothetical protein
MKPEQKRTSEAILNDITAAQETLAVDISSKPRKLQAAFEMAKNEARESLGKLTKEYRSRIFFQSRAFVPVGTPEQTKKYAEIAENVGSTFTVDMRELYSRLSETVDATIGNSREFTSDQLFRLMPLINGLVKDLGIDPINAPELKDIRIVKTAEDTTNYVRELVRNACGDVLNMNFVATVVTSKALAAKFKGQLLPVVVLNATDEDLLKLFRQMKQVQIAPDAEVDEDFVTRSFKTK